MNVAVLTCTRDRLAYTKHCFQSLRENAGCNYDHYILDQGSVDGTPDWISEEYLRPPKDYLLVKDRNIGLCPGLNELLEHIPLDLYDVIVRFDNDCEVTEPDTLRVICDLVCDRALILAPHVLGLISPPIATGMRSVGEYLIDETQILGGIFMAIPARAFSELGFRYDENFPPWTGDEAIVPWWTSMGGVAGYLRGYSVNHFETTLGQRTSQVEYEQRKFAEMGLELGAA